MQVPFYNSDGIRLQAHLAAPIGQAARLRLKVEPFHRKILVRKRFDEDATDHGARLEGHHLPGPGVVPVGQRDTCGSFIHPLTDGCNEGLELRWIVGKRSRP